MGKMPVKWKLSSFTNELLEVSPLATTKIDADESKDEILSRRVDRP